MKGQVVLGHSSYACLQVSLLLLSMQLNTHLCGDLFGSCFQKGLQVLLNIVQCRLQTGAQQRILSWQPCPSIKEGLVAVVTRRWQTCMSVSCSMTSSGTSITTRAPVAAAPAAAVVYGSILNVV